MAGVSRRVESRLDVDERFLIRWEDDLLSGAKNSYIATVLERHCTFLPHCSRCRAKKRKLWLLPCASVFINFQRRCDAL